MNPWQILFDWADGLARRLRDGDRLKLREFYSDRWGVWSAVIFYAAFVWIALVFSGVSVPRSLVFLVLAYSALTWGVIAVFGSTPGCGAARLSRSTSTSSDVSRPRRCGWRRGGGACRNCGACAEGGDGCAGCYECFEKAGPEEREICVRPPAAGLGRPDALPAGGVAFVILVLAGVAFDGLLDTPLWLEEVVRLTPVTPTLGFLAIPLPFFSVYLGFVALSRLFGGGGASLGTLGSSYVLSLVPIAIAHQVAHYYTYLLIQGQGAVSLLSDPFGWGWNLFGTAIYESNVGVVDVAFVWYSQVALIVGGHVVAVYLAHRISLRLFGDPRKALRSQYPMLGLMVLYTISSLWIVSQPIVGE